MDHDDVSNLYASHQKEDEKIVYESNNPWDAPPMRAAGFLKSTIHDMLRYAQIFANEGVVGEILEFYQKKVLNKCRHHLLRLGLEILRIWLNDYTRLLWL